MYVPLCVLTCAECRFSDGIKDWLWKMGRERERWEDMEIFYLPQGMTNKPWDLNKEVFDHQFEVRISGLSGLSGRNSVNLRPAPLAR